METVILLSGVILCSGGGVADCILKAQQHRGTLDCLSALAAM